METLPRQLRRSKDARRCFSGSENDWNRMIRSLENPGVYENPCGDLMLPALAHSLCVNVILFNTRSLLHCLGEAAIQLKMQKIINIRSSRSSIQKLMNFESKNQTKWPIELWTLKQEMETDDDDATIRESFSLVQSILFIEFTNTPPAH